MFPGTDVPRYLCSPVPMFPEPMFPGIYVPRYLCSPIFRLIFLSLQIVMNIHVVIFAHERTKSSANSIAQDVLVLAFSAKTSMIIMKKSELSTYPWTVTHWCNPTFTSKYSVLPHLLFTLVLLPQ